MTTINATINSESAFGSAAKRIEILHELGGIGTFELYLDNSSGASQILDTNYIASNLGINGTNLMQGRVDDVLPEVKDPSSVWSKYVTVKGRNYGRDLASLFYSKTYTHWRFDDLVADGLTIVGSEITYTSPSTAGYIDAEFNKTFLQDGFAEAAAKLGYGFNVKNDKAFEHWLLSDPTHTGVLLKAVAEDAQNNILKIDPETKAGGIDVKNYIMVSGGKVKNGVWTAGNASAWTGENCERVDESTITVSGLGSIKGDVTAAGQSKLYLAFPKYNYTTLDFSNKPSSTLTLWVFANFSNFVWPFTDANIVQLYLKDTAGNEIICPFRIPPQKWTKMTAEIGTSVVFSSNADLNQWYIETGTTFNWNIVRVGVYLYTPADGDFYVDGLDLDVDFFAIAEDATSQAAYGLQMLPLSRTDVKTQVQLQVVADTELLNRKLPSKKLKLTCTYQPSLLYAGYLVDVLAPTAYIGSGSTAITYLITSVRHIAEPGVDLCKGHDAITELELAYFDGVRVAEATRMKLTSSSQAAINIRYDNRLQVLEKSLSGGGFAGGGGGSGSGGIVDWSGVPFIHVKGNGYFYGQTELTCTCPTYTWAQLEPYLWGFDGEGAWTPDDLTLPLGDAYLRFTNTGSDSIDIGLIYKTGEPSPTLFISQHLTVKKDFSAVAITAHQGMLALGSGYQEQADMPQIILFHSEVGYGTKDTLEINRSTGALGKIKADTIYVDNFKKVNGTDWVLGVTALSALSIDADKDWNNKSITNLNALTTNGAVNVHGELVAGGTSTSTIGLRRITYESANAGEVKSDAGHLVLNSAGGIVFTAVDLEAMADATFNHKIIIKPDNPGEVEPIALNLYNVMVEDPLFPGTYNPVLYCDEALWVEKDILANGYIGSASPTGGTGGGCVQLGDNFEHSSDPPRINIVGDADYIAITKGSTISGESGWHITDILGGLYCGFAYIEKDDDPLITFRVASNNSKLQVGYDGYSGVVTAIGCDLYLQSPGNITFYPDNDTSGSECLILAGGRQFVPQTNNTGQLGKDGQHWYALYCNNFHGKNAVAYGCEVSKSDQEWLRKFPSREAAEEALTHQVTKSRRHTKYHVPDGKEENAKVVCICGKIGAVCEEHREAYDDLYGVNIFDEVEANAILSLELDVEVIRLQAEIADLREKLALKPLSNADIEKAVDAKLKSTGFRAWFKRAFLGESA